MRALFLFFRDASPLFPEFSPTADDPVPAHHSSPTQKECLFVAMPVAVPPLTRSRDSLENSQDIQQFGVALNTFQPFVSTFRCRRQWGFFWE
jgi:hypothetical protein